MKRDLGNLAWVVRVCVWVFLAAGMVATFAQAPGQFPGQGPQGPAPPPFHIPHIGGARQERSQSEAFRAWTENMPAASVQDARGVQPEPRASAVKRSRLYL